MEIRSLAIQTDLIFARFSSQVDDRGTYLVIKTPARPNYFWGNYVVMPEPPGKGSLQEWLSIYDSEFNSKKQGFITFAVDAPDGDPGDIKPFQDFGFRLNTNKILTAKKVQAPAKYNASAEIREIRTDRDWDQLIDVHYSDDWYLNPDGQVPFLVQSLKGLRKMCDAGLGKRFGAFLDGKVVADLGIYQSGNLGRFNQVATHRSFRRQGLCGTLVFESAQSAFESMGIDTLVMEADEDYHAAAIYESVGFRPTQRLIGLEWFDSSIHG